MRILHAGVFPVSQLQELCPGSVFIKKKIVGHCINVRQHFLTRVRFDIWPQGKHFLPDCPVIPVYGRTPAPQALIEIDLSENIKFMFRFESHLMEPPQLIHTASQVFFRIRVTYPHAVKVFRDLVSRLRVDIHRVIAQPLPGNSLIHRSFLPAIDQLVSPFSRHAHDILAAAAGEQERPVRHALLEHFDVSDLLRPAAKYLRDHIKDLAP